MEDYKVNRISYEKWLEKYKPLENEGGSLKDFFNGTKESDREIREALKNRTVWTLVTTDNIQMYISPGIALVNRSEIYITENPCDNPDLLVEYYSDDEMVDQLTASIAQLLNIDHHEIVDHITTSAEDEGKGFENISVFDLIEYEDAVSTIIDVLRTDILYSTDAVALKKKVFTLGFYNAIEKAKNL